MRVAWICGDLGDVYCPLRMFKVQRNTCVTTCQVNSKIDNTRDLISRSLDCGVELVSCRDWPLETHKT